MSGLSEAGAPLAKATGVKVPLVWAMGNGTPHV